MTVLTRGANAAIATGPVEVAVTGARQGSVDLMVFQLGPDHKVRSDSDFVFFNQPASPEGSVRLVAADRIAADLAALPSSIETLAIAVALDDAVPGSLAAIAGLAVTVSGGESHTAAASGLTVERAAVLVEIYRRAGAWKVRNVSAGWAAGLSALAGEHGVSIDEAPAPVAPPVARSPEPVDPAAALPPAVLPPAVLPAASPAPQPFRAAPAAAQGQQPSYPMPGGFPPPGGSLPPPAPFVAPRPGGWPAPGGPVR